MNKNRIEAEEIVFDSGNVACPKESSTKPACKKEKACIFCTAAVEAIATALEAQELEGYERCRKELEERNKHHKLHDLEHCLDVEFEKDWNAAKCEDRFKEGFRKGVEACLKIAKEQGRCESICDCGEEIAEQIRGLVK